MSTSRLTRLANAHASIKLIQKYFKEGNFTIQSFINPTIGSIQYKDRAAILAELKAVAANLHLPLVDPICATYPEVVVEMHKITAYRDGIMEIDFNAIWNLVMGPLENVIEPTIMILAEQIDEGEEKGEERLLSLIQDN